MDSIKRIVLSSVIRKLTYVIIGLSLAFLSDKVFAGYVYNGVSPPLTGVDSASMCITLADYLTGINTQNVVFTSKGVSGTNLTNCKIGRVQNGNTISDLNYQFTYTAPPVCTPPQYNDPVTEVCIDPPSPCEDLSGQNVSYFNTIVTRANQCVLGCEAEMYDYNCSYDEAGNQGCFYKGTLTNVDCVGSPPVQPTTPEYDCIEQGKTYGSVNGSIVCLSNGTDGAPITETFDKSDSTVTNPDGSVVDKNVETVINPDGTVTKTTKTTTTPNGGSPVTETQTEEQDKQSFCEENPTVKICEQADDSNFTGSCGSSFHCEGDAIQCAIAKDQHQRNCTLFEDATVQSDLGNAAVNGTDSGSTDNPALVVNRDIVNLPSTLNASDGGLTGTLQDVDFVISGHTITLPFTSLTSILEYMGFLVLGFAYFRAYKIVGGVS